MNDKLEKAIGHVLDSIRPNQMKADDALKFSQAALNLSHAKQLLEPESRIKSKGGAGT
jgi:hypothetical protein